MASPACGFRWGFPTTATATACLMPSKLGCTDLWTRTAPSTRALAPWSGPTTRAANSPPKATRTATWRSTCATERRPPMSALTRWSSVPECSGSWWGFTTRSSSTSACSPSWTPGGWFRRHVEPALRHQPRPVDHVLERGARGMPRRRQPPSQPRAGAPGRGGRSLDVEHTAIGGLDGGDVAGERQDELRALARVRAVS